MTQKLNDWKTPDWLKTAFQAAITTMMGIMVTGALNIVERIDRIEQKMSVMAHSIETTERLFVVQLEQIRKQLDLAATREGLRGVEKRVDELERIVRK